ncbi:hypothetical protein ACEQ8H_001796 [Pleosporales sp. CAS-2024a]
MSLPTPQSADAWDDDWETMADRADAKPEHRQPPPPLTKAQLRAQHAERNRSIWESAENPGPQWYPDARNPVPVQAPFRPKVTMLARKPAPQVLSRSLAGISLDDDSDEERRKKAEADFEQRKLRAQKERAEKERKYAQARERIFGSPAAEEASPTNSPTKPTRAKGKGRGARETPPRSSNEQSPARPPPPPAAPTRQLYDPTYMPKPGSVFIQKKEANGSRPGTPTALEKPVRQPQGPAKDGAPGFGSRTRLSHVADPS